MKITTNKFLEKLVTLKPALYTKGIIDQADHFLFTETEIISYNDRFSIRTPFQSSEKFSVPGQEFLNLIVNLKTDTFDLSVEENQVLVSAGNTRSGINIYRGGLFDIVEDMFTGKETWKKLSSDFNEAVFLCMFSISKDVSRGWMSCLVVDKGKVLSSDDLRISQYNLKTPLDSTFLIPLSSTVELSKLPVIEFSLNPSWIHFRTKDGVVFSSRLVLVDVPSADDYFNVTGDTLTLPDGLKEAVEGVSIFAEGEFDMDKRIEVFVQDGKVVCRGEKERGWIEKDVLFKYKGKKLEFLVNPIFFSQILSKSTKIIVSKDAALFESGPFRHLMSLPI